MRGWVSHAAAALVLLVVAGVSSPTPVAAKPVALARYFTIATEQSDGSIRALSAEQVDIDGSLMLCFDEEALRAAIAGAAGEPEATTEAARLRTLRNLIADFLVTQTNLTLAIAQGPAGSGASSAAREANAAYAAAGSAAIDSLTAYVGALRKAGRSAQADAFYAKANVAVLEGYPALATALQDELASLGDEIRKAIERGPRYRVQVRASLVSETGTRRLHVAGYDNLDESDPTETPRFQLAPDGRTEAELKAAGELGEMVRHALAGKLGEDLRAAQTAVVESLDQLGQTLETDVLLANLQALQTGFRQSGQEGFGPLVEQTSGLIETVRSLGRYTAPEPAGNGDETLLAVARELSFRVEAVVAGVRSLQTGLPAFVAHADRLLAATPDSMTQHALVAVRASLDKLAHDDSVDRLLDNLDTIRRSLGLGAGVDAEALAVSELAHDLLDDLDSRLDLLRAGERHSGDLIVCEAELSQASGESWIERDRSIRRAHLRMLGPRVDMRGALLFVDPRRSTYKDQKWEPVPAVSYMFHWGASSSRVWNDLLDPGIGVSMMLPDFSDQRDFEFGLTLSLSLFRSLLWTGYGRDLQAETWFFHVGINPLALGKYWNEKQRDMP